MKTDNLSIEKSSPPTDVGPEGPEGSGGGCGPLPLMVGPDLRLKASTLLFFDRIKKPLLTI